MIVLGLISGTSADGTDVAIVELNGAPPNLEWQLIYHNTFPHPANLRTEILAATQPETGTVDRLCVLNVALGEQFAKAALSAILEADLKVSQIDLIGSHGQTVWHAPDAASPGTLQLGEAAIIVEQTNIPVVSNFRARDMAVGGQGAPLVPYIDKLLLSHPTKTRVALNIGGISNLTFLPPTSNTNIAPIAFDTGPGNVLIDAATSRITQGELNYDHDGRMAANGQVDPVLLSQLLAHPYFERQPPKSTGRELYDAAFFDDVWSKASNRNLSSEDIVATITALTAYSIAHASRQFLPAIPDEIIVSGGGANNPALMLMLRNAAAPATMLTADEIGVPGDAKEALAFAILAYETWHKRPGNLPSATGARKAVVLGQITY